ncbi:hypothetical protein MTR67_019962 [Solanum verrucosum]|uniref:F-box associated domain-containing protein n=1 Tax=Solanum verrucosum TaxID=315347 RepID=A0AAF0QMF3_SOLVR|nr:hypothetical protein MTR67_019962 [Solanum verrucosum]
MQGPDINPKAEWGSLMLRGDSLANLVSDDPGIPITCIYDVWAMNQLEGSWRKVITIQPFIPAHLRKGVWEDDKMIYGIPETSQLVLYDPTTRQESLVQIKSGNDIWVEEQSKDTNMQKGQHKMKKGEKNKPDNRQENLVNRQENLANRQVTPGSPKFTEH